ncbi:hypothetical protein [Rhodococcus sp. (in: high G+C Gram-positive bacteria)]|uniref:hypothetical protein n=1 Tax=Rhodococcus sp. TaxID=1831 RepID=UPI003BAEE2DC
MPIGMGEATVDAYRLSTDTLEAAATRAVTARVISPRSDGRIPRIDDTGMHFAAY